MSRILVVDDEPHVTRMTKMKLEAEGYEVVTASNGQAALDLLSTVARFHALVTDYNMPKMDGRELCEAIRERHRGEEICIFLVTARVEGALRTWAEGKPQVEYIEKPLSLRELSGRLAKRLSSGSATKPDCDV